MGINMSKGYITLPKCVQLDVLFDHYGSHDHGRIELEQFIHRVYSDTYGANISKYLPDLFGIRSNKGHLLAAVGMRSADSDRLFLETYLDSPIEAAISDNLTNCVGPVDRADVVELGNLSAIHPGSARLIIIAMTALLAIAGYQWVTFTALPSLYNSFSRLGLNPFLLAPASKNSLSINEQAEWGRYYDYKPMVYAGRIADGYDCLVRSSLYPEIQQFENRMENVTRKDRSFRMFHKKPCNFAFGNS